MYELVTFPYNDGSRLAFSSLKDVKKTVCTFGVKDLGTLTDAFEIAKRTGMKTKSWLIGRRIRHLRKMETLKNA